MAKKRRKRKRGGTSPGSRGGPRTGGGVMQGIRSGLRRAAGAGDSNEKPSTLGNVLWTLVLLAAVGFLLYRWYG